MSELMKFNRLFPPEGIEIYPSVRYIDINDIPLDQRLEMKSFFENDSTYRRVRPPRISDDIGRAYSVVVYHRQDCIGNVVCLEYLTTPWGFSNNDFYILKRIYPKFRHTKYSRYASGDLLHILFMSKLANRLYAIMLRSGVKDNGLWTRIDQQTPCLGKIYPTDGPDVQKYISIQKEFDRWLLLVLDGHIYRSMDIKAYMMASPYRTEEVVDRWLRELDGAIQRVLEVQNGISATTTIPFNDDSICNEYM